MFLNFQLLRGSCFYCHRLLAPSSRIYLVLYQLKALDHGFVSLVQELAEILTDTSPENISDYNSEIQIKLRNKLEEAIDGNYLLKVYNNIFNEFFIVMHCL